jgi:hypothetical protein
VPYAEAGDVQGRGPASALTTRWAAAWTPSTAALLEVAGLRGTTLEQASSGVLRQARRTEQAAGGSTARQVLDGTGDAAACDLPEVLAERLRDLGAVLPATGTLPELLEGLDLLAQLSPGDVVARASADLHAAAVRQVDGLTGSHDVTDARALLALVVRREELGSSLRLEQALARAAVEGSPLMRGAAAAVRVVLGLDEAAVLGERAAGWLDLDAPDELSGRLRGLLVVAGPLLEAGGEVLEPLLRRLELLPTPCSCAGCRRCAAASTRCRPRPRPPAGRRGGPARRPARGRRRRRPAAARALGRGRRGGAGRAARAGARRRRRPDRAGPLAAGAGAAVGPPAGGRTPARRRPGRAVRRRARARARQEASAAETGRPPPPCGSGRRS